MLRPFILGLALAAGPVHAADPVKEAGDTERAFAATMKARDFAAFQAFLADEAVFSWGSPAPLVGKEAIAAKWKKYYEAKEAPFAWEPDKVAVLASGTLAVTSGPVRDPSGKVFSRFSSVWRKEPSGQWKIVFDTGEPVCDCAKKPN